MRETRRTDREGVQICFSRITHHASRSFNHRAELREQRSRVVRSWGSFGMVLHAKDRFGSVVHPFQRLIVEVDAVHHYFFWQRLRIDRESVVLRGDLDPARFEILHGLITATMTEFELERFSAERLSQDLVPQTYSKDRNSGIDQVPDDLDCIPEGGRVAWTVGKKETGWLMLQGSRSGRRGGNHLDLESVLPQPAQDVVLDAVIVRDNRDVRGRQRLHQMTRSRRRTSDKVELRALLIFLVPKKGFFMRDLFYVIHTRKPRPFSRSMQRFGIRNSLRRDEPIEDTPYAQFFRQGASIDSLDTRNAILLEVTG